MRRRFISILAVFALLLTAAPAATFAAGSTPKEVVQTTVDQVRSTVREKKASTPPAELEEELRAIISPVFDFEEMARRSLGAHWRTASKQQRDEFVKLFSDLLAKNYLKTIREHADDSQFSIVGERAIGKDKKLVRTRVNYDDQQAAIDYRLRERNGSWRVYDVIIESIGLVSNYRSEFSAIVQNEKMEGLLKRLREKKIGTK